MVKVRLYQQLNIANKDIQGRQLHNFIDISNIVRLEGGKSVYDFDCNNGKEQQLAANGGTYFGNEKSERTLCGLLNKKNPCKGLKKGWENRRLYEANGCDKKRNCESKDKGKDKDKVRANINRRIQVAVFVDNDGLLKYEVGFKCIRKDEDNKYRVDEDSEDEVCKKAKDLRKTSRRRRLLHNGGKAS